jgi:hypothetical protein
MEGRNDQRRPTIPQSGIEDNERPRMHQEEAHVPVYNLVAETHDTDPFSADFFPSRRVQWEQQWEWKRHAVTHQGWAADYINAHGGILGRQVELATADTGGDAVDAVPALRKLINVDQVSMIIGPTSVEAQAVLPILQQGKIPDIIFGGTTQLDNLVSKYVWRAFPSDGQLGVAMAHYAINKGYTRAALLFASNESAQTLVAPIQGAFQRHGGTIAATLFSEIKELM